MLNSGVYSPELHTLMKVQIAFPPNFRNLKPPFPAAILNDSQNHWTNRGAYGGWHTDSIAGDLFRRGKIKPLVLIGVVSPPSRDTTYAPPPQGRADRYADFLANTLLPWVRRRIPISSRAEDTSIIGASFGANSAIYTGLNRPDSISLVAALSGAPHFGKPLGQIMAERPRLPMKKLYIDCGTRWAYDQPHQNDSTGFNCNLMVIARQRMPRGSFVGWVAKGHYHNEEFWRKRIGRVLQFLHGSR